MVRACACLSGIRRIFKVRPHVFISGVVAHDSSFRIHDILRLFLNPPTTMSPVALSKLLSVVALATVAAAQATGTYPATPLASKHFASPTDLVCLCLSPCFLI